MSEQASGVRIGLIGEAQMIVTEAVSAAHLGSGNVPVLSTPSLILLMEKATVSALDSHLPPEQVSVGVHVDVSHLAATPLGMGVKARAEVVDVGTRRVSLKVEAYDAVEKIGEGTIQRVIVGRSRFTEHVSKKSP